MNSSSKPASSSRHSRFFLFELGWYGNIAIQCRQRKVVEFPRAGIETIQSMCPSPDENDLAEPGLNRDDEFRKRLEFGILFAHGSDDSTAEDRIFLQIRSACSLPRTDAVRHRARPGEYH